MRREARTRPGHPTARQGNIGRAYGAGLEEWPSQKESVTPLTPAAGRLSTDWPLMYVVGLTTRASWDHVLMDEALARQRFIDARTGVLGTVTAVGRPHAVPCCFVVRGDTIYSAIDAKPKSSLRLRRLDNLRANPIATLLVHHYDEDWSTLWWVRVDATVRIVDTHDERAPALDLLAAKYSQYRSAPPPGDVIALEIGVWRWWPQGRS